MRQLRKLEDLKGFHLNARDGEIGALEQIYFDDRHWVTRYFVVRTGSWLLGRDVLIAPEFVRGVNRDSRLLDVALRREKIEHAPPIAAEKPVSRHYEEEFYRYYAGQPYWGSDSFLEMPPVIPPPVEPEPPESPENPELRSSDEVMGYHIQTEDDRFGKVTDFILDDQNWAVRYLVIETGNWLSGRKVLVSPAWIDQIDWAEKQVMVDLSADLIKSAPEYDETRAIGRDEEVALYKHYGKTLKES